MKIKLLFVLFTLIAINVNGQTWEEELLYSFEKYSYQEGDPYDPDIYATYSALIPGLGQLIIGETGRGFLYLGGSLACVYLVGMAPYNGFTMIGFIGQLGLYVSSIVDAYKIAKIKNFVYRDSQKTSGLDFKIFPTLIAIKSYTSQGKMASGISLSLKF